MKRLSLSIFIAFASLLAITEVHAQSAPAPRKKITIVKIDKAPVIDGVLNEPEWKKGAVADSFIQFEPTPFLRESYENRSEVFFTYDNEGVYVGAVMHEANRDSIAKELSGRDGFGNNDFFGVVFDTYEDKLNGFEYFVTPLNEQWDAKFSPSGGEDFGWNSVFYSAVKLNANDWTIEMFIPFSAIRFGKKEVQDWGLNIVRQRRKSGQKFFWQSLDPNVNGFLTQEGTIAGFTNIKPPLRLQFSPYLSTYYVRTDNPASYQKGSELLLNGGMDVKYGINQAFTLDMTLIPDFGQVQSDNVVLNLGPFEQQFADNRPFFTEGVELFGKGNLFYSRRIGGSLFYGASPDAGETLIEYPERSKLVNATKISGRTQKGLGVGLLNAVTKPQYAVIENDFTKQQRRVLTDPLTNYNVFVLDQTLKNNSSVSLVNTSVLREGSAYDATVTAGLFDFYDKSNTWNKGGNISISNLFYPGKTVTGYSHSLYFGKASGKFNFNVSQELQDKNYDKNDLGILFNNNNLNHYGNASYNINTPGKWYNKYSIRLNGSYRRLFSPLDAAKGRSRMYQGARIAGEFNVQFKKLHWAGIYLSNNFRYNDFYEPRSAGKVFHSGGDSYFYGWFESNDAKKFSGSAGLGYGMGGYFASRRNLEGELGMQVRFNSKFSVRYNFNTGATRNSTGWARNYYDALSGAEHVIFARRRLNNVTNSLFVKYSFTNRAAFTLQTRHTWSKVNPDELLELTETGDLTAPSFMITDNLRQNFNYLSADAIFSWQFAQGSFFTAGWKSIGSSFSRTFERGYTRNLFNTINGDGFSSFSLKVIWFLDYVEIRRKMKSKGAKATLPRV